MSRKQKRVFWPPAILFALALSAYGLASAARIRVLRTIEIKDESTNTGKVRPTYGSPTTPTSGTSPQTVSPRGPIQNVRFTLYNAGIFPQQLHAKTGNVVIGIEDRTGNSLGLVVQRGTDSLGVAIGQVPALLNGSRGHTQFSLVSGNYVVFDASRPNNRAELVVEP
jgi:hypothetical protein